MPLYSCTLSWAVLWCPAKLIDRPTMLSRAFRVCLLWSPQRVGSSLKYIDSQNWSNFEEGLKHSGTGGTRSAFSSALAEAFESNVGFNSNRGRNPFRSKCAARMTSVHRLTVETETPSSKRSF
eukprot:GDKJ01042993.1.p2 GENE.GDKJ01042993.1~~GDKJ01042993.1.p2  ORF type:complete len:123 (-),score=0.21 GDKJ01042993.1:561-929(-)